MVYSLIYKLTILVELFPGLDQLLLVTVDHVAPLRLHHRQLGANQRAPTPGLRIRIQVFLSDPDLVSA